MNTNIIIGAVGGAVICCLFCYLARCKEGNCPFTCTPLSGLIVGALLGGLIMSYFPGSSQTRPSSANVMEIETIAQFDQALNSGKVVMVDFYADWCGPCTMLKPSLHRIADDYAGRIKVLAVNVDRQSELAKRHDISSIPDVRLFRDGKEIERITGLRPADFYTGLIDKLLTDKEINKKIIGDK